MGGVLYLSKSDVRQGASMFRRNMKTIKSWLNESEKATKKAAAPKKLPKDSKIPDKEG